MNIGTTSWIVKMMLKVAKILHKLGFIDIGDIIMDMINGMKDPTEEETTIED